MKTLVALYHSDDKKDEEYWDVAQTAKEYGITITETDKHDWGGENVFEVEGMKEDLDRFAIEFCSAEEDEGIDQLYPTNEEKA